MTTTVYTMLLVRAYKHGLDDGILKLEANDDWSEAEIKRSARVYAGTHEMRHKDPYVISIAKSIEEDIINMYVDGALESFDFVESGNVLQAQAVRDVERRDRKEKRRKRA